MFPAFNPIATIDKYYPSWIVNRNSRYQALIEYLELSGMNEASIKREIAILWSRSGKKKANHGTSVHAEIEAFLLTRAFPMTPSPEFNAFLEWKDSHDMQIVFV